MLLILPTAMQAQDTFALEQYFSTILQGKEPSQAPSGRIKRAKAEQYKDTVWQAWCRANRSLREETLPPIRPLTNADTLYWHLPHILEGDTLMPFYFGTKGERPDGGWPFMLYLHGSGPKTHEFSTGYILCKRYDDAVILMIHTLESMGYAAGTKIFRDRMTNDNRTDKQ